MKKNTKQSSIFERSLDILVRIASIIFFAGVFCNFLEIIVRTVFANSIDLLFDFPVWFTVWSMLLVSGVVLLDGDHVSIDFFKDKLCGTPRRILEIFNATLALIFGVFISYCGIEMVMHLYSMNATFNRALTIPKWIVELCVPLGMIIFSICALINLVRVSKKKWTHEDCTSDAEIENAPNKHS